MIEKNDSNELTISRIYDAPVQTVWEAWTDPEQVAQWWGPRGFSLTTHSKDLRVGGTWDYTMHGPDGADYPNVTTYHEVEVYRKLVYDHGASHDRPPLFRVTVLFSALEAKTKMDMTMTLPTPEAARQAAAFIKQAGGNATWDRLAEFLASEMSGKGVFVINRSFSVSRDQVFALWTEPQHLVRWLPPSGFTMEFIRGEIKSGSSSFFSMAGNGVIFYGRFQYQEISRPARIIYTQQFCTKEEDVSRPPFAPVWPETMLTTVTFVQEGPQQTRVTLECEPSGATNREELMAFLNARDGMTHGWTGSFDKLETLLSRETEASASIE